MTIDYAWIAPPCIVDTITQEHYEWSGVTATVATIKCRSMTKDELEVEAWTRLSAEAFQNDWDNPLDAGYDNL